MVSGREANEVGVEEVTTVIRMNSGHPEGETSQNAGDGMVHEGVTAAQG